MTALGAGLLEGRRAAVTGASRGIGAAIARALADAGADLALLSRSDAPLRELGEEIRTRTGRPAPAITADLGDPDDVRSAVRDATDALGGLDVLVNCAGTIERADSAELTLEQWDRVMDVNLRGAFVCAQAAFPALAEGGGAVVNIASLSSRFGIRRAAAYGASKGGLVQLTRALALEWASRGVRVNAVAPGYVETEFTRALSGDPERSRAIVARIPMGRWGTPDDISGSVVFLASDLAAYVTGQVLYVDGGYCCDG
jgi:gluconate 5-dehydrogenase